MFKEKVTAKETIFRIFEYTIPVIILVLGVYIFVGALTGDHEGIIALEGYAHGVAICEDMEPEELVTTGDAHMWVSNTGVFYTVNKGHLQDFEVEVLIDKAEEECAALKEKENE